MLLAAKPSDASDHTSHCVSVCLCLSVYAYNARTHRHTAKVQLMYYIACYYATKKRKKKTQIEIAAGLRDANLLRGNVVL